MGHDQQADFEQAGDERRLLDQLVLRSFTVTPESIHPFELATLTWDVLVPPSVASAIDVTFTISGEKVANAGSLPVSPILTVAFHLEAHSPFSGRYLGSQTVKVNPGTCQEASIPRASIQFQAQGVQELFSAAGTDSLSSRGAVKVSMKPPQSVVIRVPLELHIPRFFDADLNIDLTVDISVEGRIGRRNVVGATLSKVSVDVIFHLAEHIFSLGTATALQSMIQPLAADLIKVFLGQQVESTVAEALQTTINFFLDGWRGVDPAKRVFRLYSIAAEPEGLVILGCPQPPPPPPPPPPPVVKGKRKRRVPK